VAGWNGDELVELGATLVNDAAARGVTLRLFGGVAILARCPVIADHPKLQREHHDLDFIAPRAGFEALPEIFAARGFALVAREPGKIDFARDGLPAQARDPLFDEYHALDFTARLARSALTLPSDLLVFKLQRRKFADKDARDAIALLLAHRVTKDAGDEEIDSEYIAELTRRDWGLFTTVYDNTVELEKMLDKYLEPEEARSVWRRVELIQGAMDAARKSPGWLARGLIGRHVRWYREAGK
jgi:hypothetical protein